MTAHKQGVGTALVAHAEAELARRGCMKVNLQILHGNDAVTSFYEELGYSVEPRISMGKLLHTNIPAGRVPTP